MARYSRAFGVRFANSAQPRGQTLLRLLGVVDDLLGDRAFDRGAEFPKLLHLTNEVAAPARQSSERRLVRA